MTNNQNAEQVKEAELQKSARKQVRALEFGIDAGLADLGIDKQAFHELLGVSEDGFTELAIQRAQECEMFPQTQS